MLLMGFIGHIHILPECVANVKKLFVDNCILNWDLWYSVTGPGGPWIEIAADLPPGDISAGSIHTYDWTVPGLESNQVRVRVRQDNDGTDYEDVSDGDLTITEGIFTDGFESGFTDEWSATVP